MANIDLNVSPYFDDFDPETDYLRVLFRPGFPVQARELTTLQSFLQEQTKRFGDHVFKDGSRVTGADTQIDLDVHRLALTGISNLEFPSSQAPAGATLGTIGELEGLIISNIAGTIKAQVRTQPTGTTTTTSIGNLYIKYLTSNQFDSDGGFIIAHVDDNPEITTSIWNSYSTTTAASVANINSGVYYVQGNFSRVAQQTVVLSANESRPSIDVGFIAQDVVVTQNEDPSLFDNARGSSNEGAPGAHRYTQTLQLAITRPGAPPDPNFYRILTLVDGVIQDQQATNPEYEELGRTLARRTFDESGHYALKPFTCVVKNADSEDFDFTIGASKAYVSGFEVDKPAPTTLRFDRGLNETQTIRNFERPFDGLTYFIVDTDTGTLPGFVNGDPGIPASRLRLEGSDSTDIIGAARAYAKVGNRLYVYDVVTSQRVEVSGTPAAALGDIITNGSARGRYDGVVGTEYFLSAVSGVFNVGDTLTNETSGATFGTITTVIRRTLSDVTRVFAPFDSGNYDAQVSNVVNLNGTAVYETDRHIKETTGGDLVNTLTTFTDTGSASSDPINGFFDTSNENRQSAATKTLRFQYLRINGTTDRTGVAHGWAAADREINLNFSDVHQVYRVNTGADLASSRFTRINISTTSVIPQGSIVRGKTSRSEAIVALPNSSIVGAGNYSGNANWHNFEEGTGNNNVLEVIFQVGAEFTANEELTVEVPHSNLPAYTAEVTYMSLNSATGSNATGQFRLDNGQRSDRYDIGRLVRNSDQPAPTQDLLVFFSYFEADVNNAFFTADSYSTLNFLREDVRFYQDTQEIRAKTTDTGVDLRNSFDFRLRTSSPTADLTVAPFMFDNRTIISQPRIYPTSVFTTDINEYLGRIDSVYLSPEGSFIVSRGDASRLPERQTPADGSMALFHLNIPPAVRYPADEIDVEKVDNKRFTMRDIGDIENKINRLEEAVALSLLESQALHDNVGDRTKLGFVVDDFGSVVDYVGPGDLTHIEFKSSFDVMEKTLQPPQTRKPGIQIPMTVSSTRNISTFFPQHYVNSFTEELMSEQLETTGLCLINPFATWVFVGDVELNPNRASWPVATRDNFFFNNFGARTQVSSAVFNATVNDPDIGGIASSVQEWFGGETRRRTGGGTEVLRGRRRITQFTQPRRNGAPTRTQTGTELVERPEEFNMRQDTVTFSGENMRPGTLHEGFFAGVSVGEFTTDAQGRISGTFIIPQNIPIGTVNFELRDASGSNRSNAIASFFAQGHREIFRNVLPVRTRDVVNLGQQRTNFIPDPPQDNGGGGDSNNDPIAQSFRVPRSASISQLRAADFIPGGERSIITSIDLWFGFVDPRTASGLNTVKVEIREMVNGYPSGFNGVLTDTGYVEVSKSAETETISDATAVRFNFKKPVILETDREYCFVIKTPSDSTSVHCATVGEPKLDGTGVHDTQPNVGGHFGSFFKSQNQSTWTADQNIDLTFRLNRADFDFETGTLETRATISNDGIFNADIGRRNLGLAIETFANSNFVQVFHPSHGMHFQSAQVILSGFDDTDTYNGIPGTELNTTHTVQFATLNSYFIEVTTAAGASGRPPTPVDSMDLPATMATQPIVYDALRTNVMPELVNDDEVITTVRTANTNSLVLTTTSELKIENTAVAAVALQPAETITLDQVHYFDNPKVVRNMVNSGGEDLVLRHSLVSNSRYTSPIIERNNLAPFVWRNIVGSVLTDSDLETLTVTAPVDGDLNVNQQHASRVAGATSTNEWAAYVTKQIDLEVPADGINVLFDADMEPGSSVLVSYKVRPEGDQTPFNEIDWVDFPLNQQITERNYGEFTSVEDFVQYTARVELDEFASFKVRVRMRVRNEAEVPRIRDLRIIADL